MKPLDIDLLRPISCGPVRGGIKRELPYNPRTRVGSYGLNPDLCRWLAMGLPEKAGSEAIGGLTPPADPLPEVGPTADIS